MEQAGVDDGTAVSLGVSPESPIISAIPHPLIGLAEQLTELTQLDHRKLLEGLKDPTFADFIERALDRREEISNQIRALGGEVDHYGTVDESD